MQPSLGLKVLYVEDDLDIQEALREVLEFAGYQVTIASTATEGLEALRKERFHLVISDYNLPDFSGGKMLTLAAQAGLLNCESIILTGASTLDGTAGYRVIRKPIDVDKFLLRIHEVLAPVRDEEVQRTRANLERTGGEEQQQGKPSARVELVLYISESSPASLRALRNLEKLLARYEPSQFLLQVVDLSRERPASLDEDRIAFTPTLVKRTPAPRIYLLGSLEHLQAVEDLLSDAKVERR
jgi:DNA-binding NtrC family response regulator